MWIEEDNWAAWNKRDKSSVSHTESKNMCCMSVCSDLTQSWLKFASCSFSASPSTLPLCRKGKSYSYIVISYIWAFTQVWSGPVCLYERQSSGLFCFLFLPQLHTVSHPLCPNLDWLCQCAAGKPNCEVRSKVNVVAGTSISWWTTACSVSEASWWGCVGLSWTRKKEMSG